MATTAIDDPAVHKTAKVDKQGRVYVTTDLAGEDIRIVAEVIDDE